MTEWRFGAASPKSASGNPTGKLVSWPERAGSALAACKAFAMKLFGGFAKLRSMGEIAAKSTSAASLIESADAARDREDWRAAAAAYRQALAVDSTLEHIWVQLGNCEKESGRLEQAEAAYHRSLDLDALVADTHLQPGHVLKLRGKLAEAKASYEAALEIDPRSAAARSEVDALDEIGVASKKGATSGASEIRMIFDCSGVTERLADSRLPGGVYRIAVNIIRSALALPEFEGRIRIVFFSKASRSWREIRALDFIALTNAAQEMQAVGDVAWRAIRSRICNPDFAAKFEFTKHDALIDIGASACVEDYFLCIRNLKEAFELNYIALVYDCAPLLMPEHCSDDDAKRFASWIEGIFQHADRIVVSSHAAEADLMNLAARYQRERSDIHVVLPNGDLNPSRSDDESDRERLGWLLEQCDVAPSGRARPRFALLLSAIEPGKNHLLAFKVWERLISSFGLQNTPYLICLCEHRGMFDGVRDYLSAKPQLAQRVRLLSGIDDSLMSALYRECEFTLYPNHCEGWGAPVVELLAHGKVAVVASAPALREAGGSFALYFDPFAPGEAYAIVEKLIAQSSYKQELEQAIATGFRPRDWSEIAADVLSLSVEHSAVATTGALPSWIEEVEPGAIYVLSRDGGADGSLTRTGAHMRIGDGWSRCEDGGAWTGMGRARLAFAFPEENCRELAVYLRLKGAPETGSSVEIGANFSDAFQTVSLAPEEVRWIRLMFPISSTVRVKELTFHMGEAAGVAPSSAGKERRAGCGVSAFAAASRSDLAGRLAVMEAILSSG